MTRVSSLRPPWWLWPVLAALVVLAWRALSLGFADDLAERAPALALSWRPQHPEALYRRARDLALANGTSEEAASLARRAAIADPLDGRPYRVLAELEVAAGDIEAAERRYATAVRIGPRDIVAQAWMADRRFAQGRFPEAIEHVDRILRVSPSLFSRLQAPLVAIAGQRQAQPALLQKLEASPPWRLPLLRAIAAKASDTDAVAPIFDQLRRSRDGLSPLELEAWLARLGREERWGQAYLIWTSQLPPERLQGLGNLYNGGFEWPPGPGGFDWRFDRVKGARIDRFSGPGASGRVALRVAFEDERVPFRHVRQQLALPPGRYRLSGRARPDELRTGRGLVWTVTCARGGIVLGESEPLRGHGGWRAFEANFEVPAAGCGGQWLTLRLPARIPAEQRIGGRAWFDDLNIVRLP